MSAEKRYVVELDFFVWGESDEEAVKMAAEIKNLIKSKYDNTPQITSINELPFGSMSNRELKIFSLPLCELI